MQTLSAALASIAGQSASQPKSGPTGPVTAPAPADGSASPFAVLLDQSTTSAAGPESAPLHDCVVCFENTPLTPTSRPQAKQLPDAPAVSSTDAVLKFPAATDVKPQSPARHSSRTMWLSAEQQVRWGMPDPRVQAELHTRTSPEAPGQTIPAVPPLRTADSLSRAPALPPQVTPLPPQPGATAPQGPTANQLAIPEAGPPRVDVPATPGIVGDLSPATTERVVSPPIRQHTTAKTTPVDKQSPAPNLPADAFQTPTIGDNAPTESERSVSAEPANEWEGDSRLSPEFPDVTSTEIKVAKSATNESVTDNGPLHATAPAADALSEPTAQAEPLPPRESLIEHATTARQTEVTPPQISEAAAISTREAQPTQPAVIHASAAEPQFANTDSVKPETTERPEQHAPRQQVAVKRSTEPAQPVVPGPVRQADVEVANSHTVTKPSRTALEPSVAGREQVAVASPEQQSATDTRDFTPETTGGDTQHTRTPFESTPKTSARHTTVETPPPATQAITGGPSADAAPQTASLDTNRIPDATQQASTGLPDAQPTAEAVSKSVVARPTASAIGHEQVSFSARSSTHGEQTADVPQPSAVVSEPAPPAGSQPKPGSELPGRPGSLPLTTEKPVTPAAPQQQIEQAAASARGEHAAQIVASTDDINRTASRRAEPTRSPLTDTQTPERSSVESSPPVINVAAAPEVPAATVSDLAAVTAIEPVRAATDDAPESSAPQAQPIAEGVTMPVAAAESRLTEPQRFDTATGSERVPFTSLVDEAAQQVMSRARTLQSDGSAEVEIEIDPPELGRLNIRLVRRDGEVSARIAATEPATLELLQNELQDLRDTLAQSGVTVTRVDVEQRGQRSHQQQSDQWQQNNQRSEGDETTRQDRENPRANNGRTIDLQA